MKKVLVGAGENEYVISIDNGLVNAAAKTLMGFLDKPSTVAVVTDETVWGYYGECLTEPLEAAGFLVCPVILPPGEHNKTLEGLGKVLSSFAISGLGRADAVIAFGGGVVGDLCGFAAACYMRGVKYIQVPTTLLAQVDSSIGGKTAVNLPEGKNLAGAFYPPKAVLIDPDMLKTLPEREFKCGMAEVIKYGAIRSPELFGMLESRDTGDALADIIYRCCEIKSGIVTRDEFEANERMLLNFGHTFGHAIEIRHDYKHSHGEAVALGMLIAVRLGIFLGFTGADVEERLKRLLIRCGLEPEYRDGLCELLRYVRNDKKGHSGGVRMVLLNNIGDAFVRNTTYEELEEFAKEVD